MRENTVCDVSAFCGELGMQQYVSSAPADYSDSDAHIKAEPHSFAPLVRRVRGRRDLFQIEDAFAKLGSKERPEWVEGSPAEVIEPAAVP